jgi:hypothetical protein
LLRRVTAKIEPTIRVEMTGPPYPAQISQVAGGPVVESPEPRVSVRGPAVADFTDPNVQVPPLSLRRQQRQEHRQEQEEKILQEIFEDNLQLRGELLRLASPA